MSAAPTAVQQQRSKKKAPAKSSTPSKKTPAAQSKTASKPQTTTAPKQQGSELDRKRREQADNAKAINQASRQMEENERQVAKTLDKLTQVSQELKQTRHTLGQLNHGLDSLNGAIAVQRDSVALIREHYNRLRDNRIEALRQLQRRRHDTSTISYLASAGSMSEVYARVRYIQAYNSAWRRRSAELMRQAEILKVGVNRLTDLQQQQQRTAADIAGRRDRLLSKERTEQQLVKKLKGDNANLKRALDKRREQARQLEREIDRLLAEELERQRLEAEQQAKHQNGDVPSDNKQRPQAASAEVNRTLSGSFESNKGRLLFPVAGQYSIIRPFGRSKHPDLPMVETDNSGVDFEVPAGSHARAVFDGTVSGIFKLPGYHNVVIVRHGDYLSLYANLDAISVRKGQTLKTGQDIGSLVNDPESTGNPGKTLFHFELRHKRDKLNPMLWVK